MPIAMKRLPKIVLTAMVGLATGMTAAENPVRAQISIPQEVAVNCGGDIKQYCSKITPGDRRVVACLYAHNDKITDQCELTIYTAGEQLTAIMAALAHMARTTSCYSDLGAYCKGMPSGGGRLYKCLEKNKATLTDGCRAALPKAEDLLRRAGLLP